jgi:hypothetical protein
VSVPYLSLRLEKTRFHTERIFMKFDIWVVFEKSVEEIQVSLQYDMNTGTLLEDVCTFMNITYLAHFFLEWEIFQTKAVQKIKTHILYPVTSPPRNVCRLWENVEKYGRATQATHGNMAHAICMLDI